MFELQIIVLGLIQGITEFLPISSSAHLILVSEFFDWKDQGMNHDIAVHFGTLGAVIFYLRKNMISLIKDIALFITKRKTEQKFLYLKIIISTLPSIIIGFFIYNYFLVYFRNVYLIAYSCIIFGIILYLVDKYSTSKRDLSEITFTNSFVIGIFQAFAFIPGASRSGMVITGARLLGFNRESAAVYSLLLSIPIIFASLALALPNFFDSNSNIFDLNQIIISSLVSFITAFFSIKLMIDFVKKYNYNIFVFYRVLLGIIILFGLYI